VPASEPDSDPPRPLPAYSQFHKAARTVRGAGVGCRAERDAPVLLWSWDALYPLYAHLAPGSVAVTSGQRVRAGEVVGRVGHTGNSTAPHLHFQLMDSADPLRARGIPRAFAAYLVERDGPGVALVAHVWLDDVLPEVVRLADLVIVDDWPSMSRDDRRLLGRMYRSGELLGPLGNGPGVGASGARRVDATFADVLAGRHPGRTSPDQIILSNPFGMGILDVALAAEVLRAARQLGVGTPLGA
jgi:hypothetical protein